MTLGARVLGEFGDDPTAIPTPSLARTTPACHPSRKHPASTTSCSPATPATDASPTPATCWAFAALTASPGARAFYDQHRANGNTHNRALRALANRLVGILHGCLRHGTLYDEHTAWAHRTPLVA
jgi:hypothetical protein